MTSYIVGIAALLGLDFVWFSFIANTFYLKSIGSISKLNPDGSFNLNFASAGVAYILLIIGISLLVLPRATSHLSALGYGALFGAIVYGVYDFTNYAILTNYPFRFALVDLAWGTFVCGVVALIMYSLR